MSLKLLAVALGCTGMAATAHADPVEDFGPRRELAGHVFFPSLVVQDPFVSTYFSMSTAAGYEWIDGPSFDTLGNRTATTRSYRAAELAEGVAFQASLASCLAIRISGGGGIDAGVNGRSALVVGAIAPISAGVGATLSGKLAPNLRVGVTADLIYTKSRLLQPLVAVQESLLAGAVRTSGAFEQLNSYSALPGVTAAFTANDTLGFVAAAQYSYTRVTDGDSRNRQYVGLGISAQVDLLPALGIPIGFLGSYRATLPFESDVRVTNTVEAGIFYTGRKDLDLGLLVEGKWLDLRPDHLFRLDSTQGIGSLEMRYHWN
jgi:hypothetical protein